MPLRIRRGAPIAFLTLLSIQWACGSSGEPPPDEGAVQLLSLSPGVWSTTTSIDGSTYPIVGNGSGFVSGSVVEWNDQDLRTHVRDDKFIVVDVPADELAIPGTAQVRVRLPDGTRSIALTFRKGPGLVPFAADSITPAERSEQTEGVFFTFWLNQAAVPTSVTEDAVRFFTNTGTRPAAPVYDPAKRTVRVGPLSGIGYFVGGLESSIRTADGQGLYTDSRTVFTSTSPVSEVGEGTLPVLSLEASGVPTVTYRAATGVVFSRCAAGQCPVPGAWSTSRAGTQGDGSQLSSASVLDRAAAVWVGSAGELWFARASLGSPVTIDPGQTAFPVLDVTPDGDRHLVYYRDGFLQYRRCGGSCPVTPWVGDTISALGLGRAEASLTHGSAQRLHVVYRTSGPDGIRYATCASQCTTVGWTSGVLLAGDGVAGLSLVADDADQVGISFRDSATSSLRFGQCDGDCTNAANWAFTTVADVGEVGVWQAGTSLARSPTGSLVIAFHHPTVPGIHIATCTAACVAGGAWSVRRISAAPAILEGGARSMRIDGSGRRHVTWRADPSMDDLIRYTSFAE